jgi:UDP-N-acetylglucosamine:LPS N-acetylglucosamine transferase
MTAYELAAAGVPGIFLCLSEDHAQSASTFVGAGMGISLGVYDSIKTEEALREQISGLLRDPGQCLKMAGRCRQLVDGCGAERIAGAIAERMNVVSAPA